MPVRHRPAQWGQRRGRDLLDQLLREVDQARVASGLSCASLGRALGMSASQVARILRRELDDVGLIRVAELLAVVGLEMSARAYPAGPPIRDAASQALLARLRARLAPTCDTRSEVPVVELPSPGSVDLRAWDLAIDGPGWTARLDAETRLGDIQALLRRLALKQRDGRVDRVLLVVADTHHNRAVVRSAGMAFREAFPVPARLALRRLGAGQSPGGNALILL